MMEIKGKFYFDPRDSIYDDHFPGNPVVPGSIIVSAFLVAGKEAGFLEESWRIENFRFKGFVSPGEYTYIIERHPNDMKCRLLVGNGESSNTLVTGTIKK